MDGVVPLSRLCCYLSRGFRDEHVIYVIELNHPHLHFLHGLQPQALEDFSSSLNMRSTSVNFFLKPSFSSNDLYITWLKIILTDQVCLKFVETHVFFFHFLPVLEFLTTNFSPCENLFKELFPRNHLAHRFLGYILILKGLYTSITQHPTISTWSRHDPECEVGILWWLHAPQAGDSQGEDICEPPDGNLELIEHSDFRWFCSILLMDKILHHQGWWVSHFL